jgi:uncharacterized protein (TIGR00369 family)
MDEVFPQSAGIGEIDALPAMGARVRHRTRNADLRPGGTLSGPVMMALADYTFYLALLSQIGPQPLAVTTGLTIQFLRRPPVADLIAEAEILKLGRRLAVGEVRIYSDGMAAPVAHATVTYAIPASPDMGR